MRGIFPQVFLAVLLSTGVGTHSCAASSGGDNCPTFPPVLSLSLGDIYADAQGSVPNDAVVQKNRDLTTGVDQFMRYLEKALDNPAAGPGEASAACAYENFRTWAKAGALTVDPKPFSREGAAKRNPSSAQQGRAAADFLARLPAIWSARACCRSEKQFPTRCEPVILAIRCSSRPHR